MSCTGVASQIRNSSPWVAPSRKTDEVKMPEVVQQLFTPSCLPMSSPAVVGEAQHGSPMLTEAACSPDKPTDMDDIDAVPGCPQIAQLAHHSSAPAWTAASFGQQTQISEPVFTILSNNTATGNTQHVFDVRCLQDARPNLTLLC